MSGRGTVLVTGGSGYIAGYCIAQLLREGWTVRATLRDLGREKEVRATLGVDAQDPARLGFVAADLKGDVGWARAVDGAEYVLHVASPLPAGNPRHDDELVIPAREGTLRVLRAARDAGVRRVVMTSSTAAVFYGYGGRRQPFTEAEWSDADNLADTSAYERSKTLAERAAWAFMQREGGQLEMSTVNPGAVLGPVLGSDFSASIEIVRKLLQGSVPGCPRMGWPLVDVRDIADLHLRAMTHPAAAGQRFLGAGPFVWMVEVARMLRERLPQHARKVPSREIPDWVVRVAARFDPVVASRLFELGKERHAATDKAAQMLGWTARPTVESVVDCAQSLTTRDLVRVRR